MAWNVPLAAQTYDWDSEKQYFRFLPNPEFVAQVSSFTSKTDTILVMCLSGGRSAMAVNKLAEAGFTHVYYITDGMEGDAPGQRQCGQVVHEAVVGIEEVDAVGHLLQLRAG